jgi:hypothetical protein
VFRAANSLAGLKEFPSVIEGLLVRVVS